MINKFPNTREGKPSLPTEKKALRRALFAAIAAFPITHGDANASDTTKQTLGKRWGVTVKREPEHKNKPQGPSQKKNPELVPQPINTLASNNAARIDIYRAFVERMQGLHLVGTGAIVHQWQYEEFCRELEKYCKKFMDSRPDVTYDHEFSPERFTLIDTINRRVNADMIPISDIELHGVLDKWTMDDTGDCEEYVLNKMDKLIDAGLDPAHMHILVVGDTKGEGHAVLGVDVFRNGKRDTLILDNIIKEIVTLSEMEKKYQGRRASFLSHSGNRENLKVRFYEYRSKK